MEETQSDYGSIRIGSQDQLFGEMAALIRDEASTKSSITLGLPGGGTPQKWFRWVVNNQALDVDVAEKITWFTSDERFVPLESEESNFGNAARLLLGPLDIDVGSRMPWPTQVDPHSASIVFNRRWVDHFGAQQCFDICFLGMGDDGHTASIFPHSPLLGIETSENFASVEVPEKGWRLTITPAGLERCGLIVVLVTGAGKAERLQSVLRGTHSPNEQPVQILRDCASKVIWLVDHEAASGLR